jgi:hypothetical protein
VLFGKIVHLRSLCRDNWVVTACQPGTLHTGDEGELYNLTEDPLQRVNLWDDPSVAGIRSDLLADLWDHLPDPVVPRRECDAPV